MKYDESCADGCPHCRIQDGGLEHITQRCSCGISYTRAREPRNHILMLPGHPTILADPDLPRPRASTSADAESSTRVSVPGPAVKPAHYKKFSVPRFDDICNVKNVDFATPPMVLITDLLGYLYSVPWRIVRDTDGLCFFLDNFVCGGPVLAWQHDYRVFDDTDMEVTPENWTELGYPGISLELQSCFGEKGPGLRQVFVSKIETECKAVVSKRPMDSLDSVIKHLHLTIGASDSQHELRQLIVETATALCQSGSHAVWSGALQRTTARRPEVCLICCKQYSTWENLAKHARSHLVALRCPDDCVICDDSDLPYFMYEDVARRKVNSQRDATVSVSL
jgi:hypothetical protein